MASNNIFGANVFGYNNSNNTFVTTTHTNQTQTIGGTKIFENEGNVYFGDGSNLTNIAGPADMVTLSTTQTISGAKTFTSTNGLKLKDATSGLSSSLLYSGSSSILQNNGDYYAFFSAFAIIPILGRMIITDASVNQYEPGMIYTGRANGTVVSYMTYTKVVEFTTGSTTAYFPGGVAGVQPYDFFVGPTSPSTIPSGTYFTSVSSTQPTAQMNVMYATTSISQTMTIGRLLITGSSTETTSSYFDFEHPTPPIVKIKNAALDVVTIKADTNYSGSVGYVTNTIELNGAAAYPQIGEFNTRAIPSIPAYYYLTPPSFEFLTVQLTGSASTSSVTMTLQNNVTGTTNYGVMSSVYYGKNPNSGGTYDAIVTSNALGAIVISDITALSFKYNLTKTTGNNVNIYIQFLVLYNAVNTNFPKTYI